MVAAAKIYDLKLACDRDLRPFRVPQMGITDEELLESGDTKEVWERQLGAQKRMGGYIVVTGDKWHVGVGTNEIGGMNNGSRDAIQREMKQFGK